MKHKNFISFVGLKNMMRQGISLSPALSTRVVTSYILVIINPFFTQDIFRISSRSLNADHNSDPCHAKKSVFPTVFHVVHGLWFPIPLISYDPLFQFVRLQTFVSWSSTPVLYQRSTSNSICSCSQCVTRCKKPGQKPFFIYWLTQPAKIFWN